MDTWKAWVESLLHSSCRGRARPCPPCRGALYCALASLPDFVSELRRIVSSPFGMGNRIHKHVWLHGSGEIIPVSVGTVKHGATKNKSALSEPTKRHDPS